MMLALFEWLAAIHWGLVLVGLALLLVLTADSASCRRPEGVAGGEGDSLERTLGALDQGGSQDDSYLGAIAPVA